MAGTAMSRRASYMYGNLLPPADIIEKTGEMRHGQPDARHLEQTGAQGNHVQGRGGRR